MTLRSLLVAATLAAPIVAAPAAATAQSSLGGWDPNELDKAYATIESFKEADSGLNTYFNRAYGYAVFPSIGKAAFIVGGAHGSGTVFRGGEPVGRTSMTQATVGLSLGGQTFAEIIFFQNEAAFDRFTQGNLELAAQFSAVVVRQGASGDVSYEGGVAVFTKPHGGAMLEVSVGGQKFKYEPGSGG